MGKLVVEKFPVKGGKTTTALTKVVELLKSGKKVTYVNIEMTREAIFNRLLELGDADTKLENLNVVLVYDATTVINQIKESGSDSDVGILVIDSYVDISKELEDTLSCDVYLYTQCKRV